jgi:hypothetical protein
MRTRALLLTAAASMVGVAAMAQVTSQNIVGFVNKTVYGASQQYYTLLNNPLNGTNNNINTIIPTAPEGVTVYRWDSVHQQFFDGITYYDAATVAPNPAGWYTAAGDPSTAVLNPGEGFFLYNGGGTNFTLTFVGEVQTGNSTVVIPAAFYSFLGSAVPQSAGLSAMGFPQVDGMVYYKWLVGTQKFSDPLTYTDGVGWNDGVNLVEPTPDVGEGFVIQNPNTGTSYSWTRTFTP